MRSLFLSQLTYKWAIFESSISLFGEFYIQFEKRIINEKTTKMSHSGRDTNPYYIYRMPIDGTRLLWPPGFLDGRYFMNNRGLTCPAGEDWNRFLNGGSMSMQMRDRWSPDCGKYYNANGREVDFPGWEKWVG